MASFENVQGITHIKFSKKLHNFCPLGNDWYTNNLVIEVVPDKVIPDYIDVENDINELNNQQLIIEDVVSSIYNTLIEKYKFSYLKVTSCVDDAVHLPVVVEKETK